MNIENDPRIERPADPSAPVIFDLGKCQRWIAKAENYRRQPMGDFVVEVLGQLKCAVDQLAGVSTRIADANNQMLGYQKDAETANAEVRAMQRLLGDEREKVTNLTSETAALKVRVAELEKEKTAASAPSPAAAAPAPKRVRKAKVVPIETPKAAAQ
jgi:hypothetical protein